MMSTGTDTATAEVLGTPEVSVRPTLMTVTLALAFTASASMNFSNIIATVLNLATQEPTAKLTSTNAHQTRVSMDTALIK